MKPSQHQIVSGYKRRQVTFTIPKSRAPLIYAIIRKGSKVSGTPMKPTLYNKDLGTTVTSSAQPKLRRQK